MNDELREFLKNQHEYTLMEIRVSHEDLKEHMEEKYGKRLTRLEHWRTFLTGAFIGITGWFKLGEHFK